MWSNSGRVCDLCVLLSSCDMSDGRGRAPAATTGLPRAVRVGFGALVLVLEREFSFKANLPC